MTNSNIIIDICYFAVPVFFMISGTTLMDYRERYDTKTYFLKRIKHIFIPYVIWSSMIYIARKIINPTFMDMLKDQNIYTIKEELVSLITALINSSIMPVYWFFIPLFAIYIGLPFISLIPSDKRKDGFFYAIVAFSLLRIIEMICFCFNIEYNMDLNRLPWEEYMIYPVAGSLLGGVYIEKKNRRILYLFGIIGFILLSVCTLLLSRMYARPVLIFRGYRNLPAFLYAVAIFVFVKNIQWDLIPNKIWDALERTSSLTFGIFLMHQLIVILISRVISHVTNILEIFLIGSFVFLLCTLISYLMNKIPIIKHLIGN